MKEEKTITQKIAQVNRVLDLINDAEKSIEISEAMGDSNMIKEHQLMRKELVDELLELLKTEFKINLMLDKSV